MIECTHVYKRYSSGTNALYDINLDIDQGEFVYIIGPTGAGKSTLIKLLDGEEKPTKGTVKVAGIDVGRLKRRQIPLYRRNIGVVFQDFKLLGAKTVFENVAYALEVINVKRPQIEKRVTELLDILNISEIRDSFPDNISGGQKQRVAIARAMANRPKVLIADEPTGNLDLNMSMEVMESLERINRKYGTTIVMVTHDVGIVNRRKKRTLDLEHGHIVADLEEGGDVTHDI